MFSFVRQAVSNTSSSDELPDIPGTRFPWMSEDVGNDEVYEIPQAFNELPSTSSQADARERNRLRAQKSRANKTSVEKANLLQSRREKYVQVKKKKTEEEVQLEREKARKRKEKQRNQTKIKPRDGLRSQDILNGTFKVAKLETTSDGIGSMDTECQYCGALKFSKESATTCCSEGKVKLAPFPRPPEDMMKLWLGKDAKSRILREHSRMINNAVCLSSLKVKLRNFQGFTPSIVFQGRVQHRAGALLPAEGELPRFAQLYVFDPTLETSQRFSNMNVPSTMSVSQKAILRYLLQEVQAVLHQVNPYVQDFKQILELPEEDIADGKIVITAAKPNNEHARRYNAPTNLQEVSILLDPGKHDLVLQKRGGSLQTISVLNPKGMPMHFTLLFPHGTYGWDPDARHADGKRRVTPREFYAFHLNLRRGENENFLHMTCKLFQEWICMGWVQVEDQRLNFQSQNQKALRADSYKNVKQATEERMRELGPREDGLYPDDHHQPAIGRKILASSFTGSPRFYMLNFKMGWHYVGSFTSQTT